MEEDDNIENILNNYEAKIKTEKTNIPNSYSKKSNLSTKINDKKNIMQNKVAKKFNLVIIIMKFLGYFSAFVSLIIFISLNNFGWGLLSCFVIAVMTWLSTLIFEAIAEGLNLLEDIKNK